MCEDRFFVAGAECGQLSFHLSYLVHVAEKFLGKRDAGLRKLGAIRREGLFRVCLCLELALEAGDLSL